MKKDLSKGEIGPSYVLGGLRCLGDAEMFISLSLLAVTRWSKKVGSYKGSIVIGPGSLDTEVICRSPK